MNAIQLISAPSILGLKPTGVEDLGNNLLAAGLAEKLGTRYPVINVDTLNHLYSKEKEVETLCLNTAAVRDFSLRLGDIVSTTIENNRFPFVLGGDCSILIGIMPALKASGEYGLIFFDAHADFYEPERSVTGELADMDLAIVTGRGPEIVTNISNLRPYVKDEHVIHLGQRDQAETKAYHSRDIRETAIRCISLAEIERDGALRISSRLIDHINQLDVGGYWIHFDADVLSDKINPAVDYRLPGGLVFDQAEQLIRTLLLTGRITGISVSIFNPKLDKTGKIAASITQSLGKAFDLSLISLPATS